MPLFSLPQELRLYIDAYRGRYTPATREDLADQKVAQVMRFAEIQKMPARTLLGGLARQTPSFMKLNPSSRSYKQHRMIALLGRVEKQALVKIRESLHFLNREVELLDCSDAELNALWKEIGEKKVARDNAWCRAFEVIVTDIFDDPVVMMEQVFPNGQEGLTLAERAKAIRSRLRKDLEIPDPNDPINQLAVRNRELLLKPLAERFPDLFSDLLRTTSRADFDLVLSIYVQTGSEEQIRSLLESNCTLSPKGLAQALLISMELERTEEISALILGNQRPLGALSQLLQMAIDHRDWVIARKIIERPEQIVYPRFWTPGNGKLFKNCMEHEDAEAQEIGWLLWASDRAQIDCFEVGTVLDAVLAKDDEATLRKMMSRPDRMRPVLYELVCHYEKKGDFKQALLYFSEKDPSCYTCTCLLQCVQSTDVDLRQRALEIFKEKEMKPDDVGYFLHWSDNLELAKILLGRHPQLLTIDIYYLGQEYIKRDNVEFLLLFITYYPDHNTSECERELGKRVKNAAQEGRWDFVDTVLNHQIPDSKHPGYWACCVLEGCLSKNPEKAMEILSRSNLSFDPFELGVILDRIVTKNNPAWDPVIDLILKRPLEMSRRARQYLVDQTTGEGRLELAEKISRIRTDEDE